MCAAYEMTLSVWCVTTALSEGASLETSIMQMRHRPPDRGGVLVAVQMFSDVAAMKRTGRRTAGPAGNVTVVDRFGA